MQDVVSPTGGGWMSVILLILGMFGLIFVFLIYACVPHGRRDNLFTPMPRKKNDKFWGYVSDDFDG